MILLMRPKIGILLGEATGVGPEIVAKVCAQNNIWIYCKPILIGDSRVLKAGMEISDIDFPFSIVKEISKVDWDGPISILDTKNLDSAKIKLGQISEKSGRATGELFEKALQLIKKGDLEGFTFAPYNKLALDLGGYNIFKLFAHYLKVDWPFGEINVANNIWISRVTSHIPLKEVSKHLNPKNVTGAIELAHKTMCLAGIDQPRIAVAALNPHGGENGLFGTEEIDIIIPAVNTAKSKGINALGPFPADTIFVNALKGFYDGITTMYHDQGQIALKLMNFESAVTIIAGVSCPITTPSHGTAYDIVGKGIANAKAMEQAIKIAAEMAKRIGNKI